MIGDKSCPIRRSYFEPLCMLKERCRVRVWRAESGSAEAQKSELANLILRSTNVAQCGGRESFLFAIPQR